MITAVDSNVLTDIFEPDLTLRDRAVYIRDTRM